MVSNTATLTVLINFVHDTDWLIEWLLLNTNISNISAISWREQILLLNYWTWAPTRFLEIKHKTYLSDIDDSYNSWNLQHDIWIYLLSKVKLKETRMQI